MKKLLFFLLNCCCIFAYANVGDNNDPVYFDFNVGTMNSLSADTSNSFGTNINAGYMFNRYYGVEGGLIYSPVSISGAASNNNSLNYYALDAAIKGVIPFSHIFSLYGKIGVSQNLFDNYSKSSNGQAFSTYSIGGLIGAGAQFNLSKNWSLHIEDEYIPILNPVNGAGNPNFVFAGAEFKF